MTSIDHVPLGWDDAFERAVADHEAGRGPTALCAIQATVDRPLQGQGLSRMVLREMRHRAAQAGLAAFRGRYIEPNVWMLHRAVEADAVLRGA